MKFKLVTKVQKNQISFGFYFKLQ